MKVALKQTIAIIRDKSDLKQSNFFDESLGIEPNVDAEIVKEIELGNDVVIFSIPKNYTYNVVDTIENAIAILTNNI